MGPHGPHGGPWAPHGPPWAPMGPYGALWGPHGAPWGPMGSPGPYPMAGPYPCSGYPQAVFFAPTTCVFFAPTTCWGQCGEWRGGGMRYSEMEITVFLPSEPDIVVPARASALDK